MVKAQKTLNKDKCLIYLADLAHNYAANGPFTFPINIGYIAAYAKKVYGDKIEIFLNDTGSPALIKDPADFDSIFVVMPMKG